MSRAPYATRYWTRGQRDPVEGLIYPRKREAMKEADRLLNDAALGARRAEVFTEDGVIYRVDVLGEPH